ncbi:class I SAM-dependent methyltransferase [Trueperella sp. LYQ143]|uniref:class I SAM-dependent methyltransferase n=1 Tax=unclassified Trueperella TaxID=2630174 RepID=UPI003983753A
MARSTRFNPYTADISGNNAQTYEDLRPSYPREKLACLNITQGQTIADIGAGTGKLTQQLRTFSDNVWAVEPSEQMREHLKTLFLPTQQSHCLAGRAEQLPFPDESIDVITYGQCWHWLDEIRASAEAARVCRVGARIAIIGNYLDIRHDWVHRLSRIMRSGDIRRATEAPDLRVPGHHGHMEYMFSEPSLEYCEWTDQITAHDVFLLTTTRASWILADTVQRERTQENLQWYLYDHLGYRPDDVIDLPYRMFMWVAIRNDCSWTPAHERLIKR